MAYTPDNNDASGTESRDINQILPHNSGVNRRDFMKILGAGILISTMEDASNAQQNPSAGQKKAPLISGRVHVGTNGVLTVMTGRVELGQGSRTELTMVAAEELRARIEDVRLVMGDTALVPDDGSTGSSTTTPVAVPKVRKECAAARNMLIKIAADMWQVNGASLQVSNGTIKNTRSNQSVTYAELAQKANVQEYFSREIDSEVSVTPVSEWKVMGKPTLRINSREIVTGAHQYASDIIRPNMYYGKVLNPPAYHATLETIDLKPAEAMENVIVVREGDFIAVAAPTTHLAEVALNAIAATAQWKTQPQISNKEVFTYLKEHVVGGKGEKGRSVQNTGSVQDGLAKAAKVCEGSFLISHIQHATLEPRAAAAEWEDGKVTVWTGTADPFPIRNEIAKLFQLANDQVRVIVPDTGGHFCGKHTAEAAIQAVHIAKLAKRPIAVRWTRYEDFRWAYFRKAGVIELRAGLDIAGKITTWDCVNYNSGDSALATPYDIPNASSQVKSCESPLREGSYRAVAAPANLFARESFMDELAHAANADPLEFRLKHIKNDRLKAVLETAAKQFDWNARSKNKAATRGLGLACATEKGSYVAACVEIEVNRVAGEIKVLEVCQAFDCGAIINPINLRAQMEGAIIMGMSGALWEEIKFEDGKILNGSFRQYRVSRFKDVPEIKTIFLDHPELPSVGAGETPLIVIAPAIANAVFNATGVRIRTMPIKGENVTQGQGKNLGKDI